MNTLRDATILLGLCIKHLFKGQWRKDAVMQAMVQIGVESLPIITIATAFAGMVVTEEMAWHMYQALQNISIVPGLTGQFILRELGIAIPALLLVSKVGASITAEVGSMRITDQIDALKLLKIDPVLSLVFPRWLASILCTMCLTLIAVVVTLVFSIAVSMFRYGFNLDEYLVTFRVFVGLEDVLCALVKSAVFGAVIPLISCAYGFRCEGGAQGVGSATTDSVVASTLAVIVLDFVLTAVFSTLL